MVAREAQLRKFFQNVDAAIREAGEITETSTAYEVGCVCVCVCLCVHTHLSCSSSLDRDAHTLAKMSATLGSGLRCVCVCVCVSCLQAPEHELLSSLQATRTKVHECLLDSVDTPGALQALADLIKDTNKYMDKQKVRTWGARCAQTEVQPPTAPHTPSTHTHRRRRSRSLVSAYA